MQARLFLPIGLLIPLAIPSALCAQDKPAAAIKEALGQFNREFKSALAEDRIQALELFSDAVHEYRSQCSRSRRVVKTLTAALRDRSPRVRGTALRVLSVLAEEPLFMRIATRTCGTWIQAAAKEHQRYLKTKARSCQENTAALGENIALCMQIFARLKTRAREQACPLLEQIASPRCSTFLASQQSLAVHVLEGFESPDAVSSLARLATTYLKDEKLRKRKILTALNATLERLAHKYDLKAPTRGAAVDGAWETFATHFAKVACLPTMKR